MSTPIKPPGGAPGAPPDGASGPDKAQGAGEGFREALSEAGAVGPASTVDAAQTSAAVEVRAIADDLAAGRIDREGAVEALVQRALASAPASSLTPERRQALEQFLRQTIADDPTMAALTRELDGS